MTRYSGLLMCVLCASLSAGACAQSQTQTRATGSGHDYPNRPIIDKLFAAAVAVMQEPEMQEFLVKRSIPLALSASPAEFNAYVQSEMQRWVRIIKDNGVKIE